MGYWRSALPFGAEHSRESGKSAVPWGPLQPYTLRAVAMTETARFFPASDQTLLVYLGERVSLETHERVAALSHLLETEPIPGVRNLHPAYSSLLVKFDPLRLNHDGLQAILRRYLERLPQLPLQNARDVEIPVCYGGKFGEDLEDVAALTGISAVRVIELHTSVTYHVYFLGFVPGFAYLGELPAQLATPRLATPRRRVPTGSVGIADNQTGVYPFATPGGWRLIGRTPLAMFRPDRAEMSALSLGDRVRFVAVSPERFAEIAAG